MEKNLKVWFNSPQFKVRPRSHLTWGKVEDYHIYVAKNATEGCQVSVKAPTARQNMSIEIVGDRETPNFEIELLRVHYVDCGGTKYPDPVVFDDGCFDLEEECNVTYLINAVTNENSVAGEYNFTVLLKEQGEVYGEYPLTITVWNFTISPQKHMDTSFGINREFIELHQKSDDYDALYKKYYDFMLERYHCCGYYLPYDILDPRADEYMDNPKVTSFMFRYSESDEKIAAYYEKLKNNPVWLKKCFLYVEDEPCNMEAYSRIEAGHERLKNLFPGYNAVSPFFQDPSDGDGLRAVDLLEKFNSIWCPKINLYKQPWFVDYMKNRDALGDRTWWYVCWEPGLPYCNLLIDMEGFYHRVMFWQQYLHDVRGLLYWTTTHWPRENPWDSGATVPVLSEYCFGDGHLLYPGDRVGVDGPVGSLRFELIRYGIEDYYMMQQAEKAFGREWVDEKIKSVTPTVNKYNDDHEELDRVRIEIGNRLSEYMSK